MSFGELIQIELIQIESDFWRKLHIAQSFFHYLQKHHFGLLCHDSESVYGENGVISTAV